jgi:hypothetical protein
MYNKNDMEAIKEEERIKREQRKMRAEAKRNAAQQAKGNRTAHSSKGSKVKAGKGFAIMRIQKLKTFAQITGAGKHVQRLQNTPNANPELIQNNRQLLGSGDLSTDVKAYIEANVEGNIRKNAVLCVEQLLTASPEYFQNDPDNKKLRQWVDAQMQYIKQEWGDNCVSAVLHLDETTPHIHAHIVPVVNKKLNQKALIGGSKFRLVEMQNDYADAMKHLGLQRGIQKTKAHHEDIKRFYSQIRPFPAPQITVTNSLKTILNPSAAFAAATKQLQQELEAKTAQLNALQASMGNTKKRALAVDGYVNKAKKEVKQAEQELTKTRDANDNLRTINDQLVSSEAQVAEQLALYKKYEAHIKELEEQQRLEREQALTKQQEIEQQAMRQEYYKNKKNERRLG